MAKHRITQTRGVTRCNKLGEQYGAGFVEGVPSPVGGGVAPSPENEIFFLKRRVLAHFEQTGAEIALP